MITDDNNLSFAKRFGRSPFWLRLDEEQYAAAGSASTRAVIALRPPRARKLSAELPLIDISPRHPLFTVCVAGESFPLLITRCENGERGAIVLGGTRKMMLKSVHTMEWTARIRPQTSRAAVQLKVEFKATINPPLPGRACGDLKVEIYSPMHRPEPWSFPYGPESHHGALALWGALGCVALSLVTPHSGAREAQTVTRPDGTVSLVQIGQGAVRRGKAAYTFLLLLDSARTRSHAQFMHMRHAVKMLEPGLPELPEGPPTRGLRDRALLALQRLTDKGVYDSVGVERVYVRAETAAEAGAPDFFAGFPYFPLDAARAMLDWNRLVGDDVGARLSLLIARGIASDFAVIGDSEAGICANKGAFWDRRKGSAGARDGVFTDFLGDDFHSIASTSRIARGLFSVYERTRDTTSLNAAVNACHWLILKQNSTGYYDGDRVCAATGAVLSSEDSLAGVEAVIPLLQAFRATGNEVFVKAGMRVLRHVTQHLMPALVASPIYRSHFSTDVDSPATVASLVRALAYAHSEASTRRTREELEMAGTWLRSWDLTREDTMVNYDGRHDGRYEIARAALSMLAVDRNPAWMEMALRVAYSLPDEAHDGWQALPLFLELMTALTGLLPGGHPNLIDHSARVGWSDYAPDATTSQYIQVSSLDGEANVDHLPLVSRSDNRVLITVLADRPIERVEIVQNGRRPNATDLRTGEIHCQPFLLHKFPFQSPMRWGCFTIEV